MVFNTDSERDNFNKKKIKKKIADNNDELINDKDIKKIKNKNNNYAFLSSIYENTYIVDALLLLVIYLILSLDIIKDKIESIFGFIKSKNGDITNMGIILYGIILTVLFSGMKYVLNKKMIKE